MEKISQGIESLEPNIRQIEKFLSENIFPDLERGRPNFDAPHTIAVVYHLKQILHRHPNLDAFVMVISAYAHDWGYSDIFAGDKSTLNIDDVKNAKELHMVLGAQKIRKLLREPFFDFLTNIQKARVEHLVAVHDQIERLSDEDELVLMEADTLGALDHTRVEPSFNLKSYLQYIQGVRNRRFPKFLDNEFLILGEEYMRNGQKFVENRDEILFRTA